MSATETELAWDPQLLRDPHAVADKRSRVQQMFAAIAPSYDLNNRLHSLGVDQLWRNKAVALAAIMATDSIVDVACGTGDLTIKFARKLCCLAQNIGAGQVLGIDFTFQMLPIANRKWHAYASDDQKHPAADTLVKFINGDAQALPLPDQSADVVSIAFGIRNVAEPLAAVREFHRILRPGGRLVILEFSLPTNRILRGLYNFYFRKILPRSATIISGDKTGAYRYLPESVNTFIGRQEMMQMMGAAGFQQVEQHAMTFGVCVCYRGVKPL